MPTSDTDLNIKAKSMDYMLRSGVSGVLALGLVGALVYSAVTGITIEGQTGAALLTATGTVIGYFFGNHAAVNGSILTSLGNRRIADTVSTAASAALLASDNAAAAALTASEHAASAALAAQTSPTTEV